jgi:hypothetical protein
LRQYINLIQGKKVDKIPANINPMVKDELTVPEGTDPKVFFMNKIKEILGS